MQYVEILSYHIKIFLSIMSGAAVFHSLCLVIQLV